MNQKWQYLEQRPHKWRKQLYFKGKRLRPYVVWIGMQTENLTISEAADNWDLPIDAIKEAIAYCESETNLLNKEAKEEKQLLEAKGYSIAPKIIN